MGLLKKLRQSDRFKAFLFNTLRVVPMKRHKVVFCNFSGKRCGDSPRNISDALRQKHPDWDLVWLSHPKYNPPIPEGCRMATFGMHSLKMVYELATAKVWVDSHTKFAFTRKRKNQYYMETWHGGIGLKKVEGDVAGSLDKEYLDRVKVNSALADVFLSNSRWCSELYRRAFWFRGDFLECGLPRNDALVQAATESSQTVRPNEGNVRKHLKLSADTKIALYAPTFRADNATACYGIDALAVQKELEAKFGGHWIVLIRLHPMAMQLDVPISFGDTVLNATDYPNMQELLVESDLLLSDYSSCIFDYALLKRPCLLFATDIEDYKRDRDLYFDLRGLPFPLAESNRELLANIAEFDSDAFRKSLDEFIGNVGLNETGHATERAVELIEKWIEA